MENQVFFSAPSLGQKQWKAGFWCPITNIKCNIQIPRGVFNKEFKNRTVLLTPSHKALNSTVTILIKIIQKELENLPSSSAKVFCCCCALLLCFCLVEFCLFVFFVGWGFACVWLCFVCLGVLAFFVVFFPTQIRGKWPWISPLCSNYIATWHVLKVLWAWNEDKIRTNKANSCVRLFYHFQISSTTMRTKKVSMLHSLAIYQAVFFFKKKLKRKKKKGRQYLLDLAFVSNEATRIP